MSNRIYMSTPIYYVNAAPHHGHAYTTIVVDCLSRFYKLMGYETFFLTGTDEHGDKVAEAAEKAGISPEEYADKTSKLFRDLWPQLQVENDRFIRTSDEVHIRVVQQVLQEVYDKGDIYFGDYGGLYCFGCERFLTEKELVEEKCPDHDREPVYIKEKNYFFRMSKYQDWLIQYIADHPDFIRPERYRNEVVGMMLELEDLCISRPKSRLSWGIPLPFDEDYVTYVWFDALLNYISGLYYPNGELFKKFWPVAEHFIAKDILKPHAIYWPTMLRSIGLEPARHLNVHGYWNVEGAKMSKSRGNVIKPLELKDKYGLDAFRYFMLREMVFGLDASFSEVAMVNRINSDLANDLGNLTQRSLTMAQKYFQGEIQSVGEKTALEEEFVAEVETAVAEIPEQIKNLQIHRAMESIWRIINLANKYIDSTAPWALAKDPSQKGRLEAVIYHLMEVLRIVAVLVSPVMPDTSKKIMTFLAIPLDQNMDFDSVRKFGGLSLPRNVSSAKQLFPRIEWKGPNDEEDKPAKNENQPQQITFDDFSKLEICTGKVLAAEAVPKADKLLKLTLDIKETRTVVAGVAEHYKPDELLGKTVIVLRNLKPQKIRGIKSEGMVLAVKGEHGMSLLTVDKDTEAGLRVS